MTDEYKKELYDELCKLSGEQVLNAMTDWHGMQLLDEDFAQHCVDEGLINLSFIED